MSCPGCGFFNVPGTAACVACGTALAAGGSVAVATEPPRATGLQKRMRRARRALLGADVAIDTVRPSPGFLLLALVPGLSQAAQSRYALALALAAAWAAMAAVGVWLFGHPLGTFAVASAIGVHYFSALLPWRPALSRLGKREAAFASLAAYGLLAACLYYPAQRYFQREYLAIDVNAAAPPVLRAGDRVLVRVTDPGVIPEVGSVVAIRSHANALLLDRVLGLPGDRVEYSKGEWRRNGALLEERQRPLVAGPLPDRISVVVPPGQVYVWPSVNLRVYGNGRAEERLGFHNLADLVGTAWRITAPFGRRGPLEHP